MTAPVIAPNYDNIHMTTLENGLDVVVVEDHDVPIVTVEIAAKNGAFTEPPEYNGLSHLYEHMFFKANEELPNQEAFMERRRELGAGGWNGTTGNERVNYFFTVPTENLAEGVEFMANAIRTPLFKQEELEKERIVVLGEYDRNEADPFYHLYDQLKDLLWYEYPTRKDSLGDRDTITSATVEQMRWMQETYYIPNNSLLILAGDVTAEQGFDIARQYLGEWERGADPSEEYPIPEHPPLQENVAAVVTQPVNVSVIKMAWHGPDTQNDVDATYAADVFSFILSQAGSTFQQRLVDSGIALSASIGYSTQRYTGPISVTAVVQPGKERQAINAINRELAAMTSESYYTDEQMETAKTLLAVDDLRGQQAASSMAHTLSYWWASASVDYYLSYVQNLRAVTREDITEYVNTYITDQPRATVLLSSEEAVQAGGWTADSLISAVESPVEEVSTNE
jgi:zinc protease